MPIQVDEHDFGKLNVTFNADSTELVPASDADYPAYGMTDAELIAYAVKQDGVSRDLSCRSVVPFFRRGWALWIIFNRNKGKWAQILADHNIGRTWATYARQFYEHYHNSLGKQDMCDKERELAASGKTIYELLIEVGILAPKLTQEEPCSLSGQTPKPKPTRKRRGPNKPKPAPKGSTPNLVKLGPVPEPEETEPERPEPEETETEPETDEQPLDEETLLSSMRKAKARMQKTRPEFSSWNREDRYALKTVLWEIMDIFDEWINEIPDVNPKAGNPG